MTTRLSELEHQFIEKLAALEHEQWMNWANAILLNEDISLGRRKRWEKFFVPYEELSESDKHSDREWARKVFKLIKTYVED